MKLQGVELKYWTKAGVILLARDLGLEWRYASKTKLALLIKEELKNDKQN